MLTRIVSGVIERQAPMVLPFGWTRVRIENRCAWRIGPWWILGWRRLWTNIQWEFYLAAMTIGAFDIDDGDLYSNGRWWPSCPRFTDTQEKETAA